jgi:cell shape-determining protein MreC
MQQLAFPRMLDNDIQFEIARAERDITAYVSQQIQERNRLRRKCKSYKRELKRLIKRQTELRILNEAQYETIVAQSSVESEAQNHNRTLIKVLGALVDGG